MTYQPPAHLDMTDSQLLAECDVVTYRASGPGGQKRNKTESAVRVRHRPSGLKVVATESRSQAENRTRALRRMREALVLNGRVAVDLADFDPAPLLGELVSRDGRLRVGRRDPRRLLAMQVVLDVLAAAEARVAESAEALGLSTAHLIAFLKTDPKLWTEANAQRRQFGHKPLR